MKSLQILAVTGAVACASSAFGGVITFENAPSQYWEIGSSFNGHTGGGQDLGGFYQGVTFGPDAQITTTSSTYPADGNFELTGANPANATLSFTFNAPQPDVSFQYNSEFGFLADAYDSHGNLLGFATGNGTYNFTTLVGTPQHLDFGFGNISTVVITDDLGVFGTSFTIDDLTAVGVNGLPAPDATSTLGLFGVAALGLLAFRRKVAA